nr:hypothetical protein [Tanacetum cinerariifolium]
MLDNATTITDATTIAPGMFKLDIEPLSHRLKNNRDAHEDYLKKTIENTDTICGLVERARKQNLSEPFLDSAYKLTKDVQELLVYVSQTCPSFTKPSEKLVAVTPMNKVKKVRVLEPLTSSSNINKQVVQIVLWYLDSECSKHMTACALGKSKKSSHQPKAEDTNQEKIYLLHMDLCGLIRVASVGIKSHLDAVGIIAALAFVNTAQDRSYYFSRTSKKNPKCLRLLVQKKQFGGNAATKKTKRNLLKQQYENFTASSSEILDQTFDRIQKLASHLELLGEKLSQEDINQKLLRSLSPEWYTHTVVWRNKADLDTMSMNDLYNNLKVYEPKVKRMSSSNSSTQNMAFVSSSNNSTNGALNTAHGVSTASTQVNVTNSTNIDYLRETLLGSAELQEIKIPSTRKGKEGTCLLKQLLSKRWCPVMVLDVMIEVIK